ncbi:hypothetical protein [Treponema denticola]|uniref:hypothetical protein n=1 Tax=Treponema denticola TaxID=158 RepID=UPI0002B5B05E|nr:hypothetical protein [Treponema denticola]EMB43705.1 hypothetical protein HMPREF9729_02141 [Treponema denticola ASLM]EMD56790.1 hypothetical protein HMPREF9728_01330 [Treponema denticola US-Trep]
MRKFFYGSIFIILILTLTTCKQFIADIEKDFENWVSTVLIKEIIPDSPKDGQSYLCIPSASDQTVTLKLLNSRRHSLKMPEGPGTYTDIITFESGVKGIDGGVPVHGTDYELEQIGFDEIRLKYKKAFLKKYEYGNRNLSPRITFISKEGRKFETRTFKLRCNTPPPDITDAVICKTRVPAGSLNAYYVLCISCDSDKLKEKMGGDFLHKDIKSIIINGTEYPIELNSSGTGFTTTDSNFIAKTDVLPLGGSPTPDANLYFKTNAVVGGIKTDYTLYIGDEKKLSSSNKKTVSTPANTPDNAKLYDKTVTSSNEILTNSHDSPYTIAYKDIGGNKIKLKAETATRGAIIKGEVKKYNGSTYIDFANINSGSQNSVDIELPKPVSGDVFYEIEFRAEGDGFTPSDLQIRYVKLIEGGTVTITSTDGWKKLKAAVEASNGPNLIIIDGEIKAESTLNNYGEITVTRTLTIKGKTDSVSDILNANKNTGGKDHHRIFKIETSGNLTLDGLTLTGGGKNSSTKLDGAAVYSKGSFTAKNCKFEDNEAGSNSVAGAGGAVYIESGQTTIDNCKFISNNANIGGAVFVAANGKCTIGTETDQTTKIYSNTAKNGAGIYVASTKIDGCLINKGTIIGSGNSGELNEAKDFGGGIFVFGAGNCTIKEGVKIQNNKAQNGGGIYNDVGNLTIQGTVSDKVIISGCKANSSQPGKKKGGGIYIAGGTVKIEHTLINGNTVGSSGEGQGIYVADGTFEMKAGAKIDENNDVYLKEQKTIKVETSDLGDFGAKITPEKYPDRNTVIKVLEGSAAAACNDKFKVPDKSSTHWKVDKRGNLAQLVKKSSDSWTTLKNAVANAHQDAVIYIDGEIKASSSGSNFGAIEIKKPDDFTGGVDWKLTIMGLTGSDSDILNANYGTGGNITKHRIFKVYNGADFTIEGLTLKGADSGTKVGGAIYTEGKVEMANCVITENKVSAVRGGGVLIAGGTFTMIGGEIKNNKTNINGEGGGVCINGGTFKMIGGRIKENNQSVNSNGKGVYVAGGSFTMSGSAKIDENNDVYLPTNRTINILSKLTAEGTAAMINPQRYPSGSNNIKVLADDISNFANYKKFKVKSNGGTPWYVNSSGNLTISAP